MDKKPACYIDVNGENSITGKIDISCFLQDASEGVRKVCDLLLGNFLDLREAKKQYLKAQVEKNTQSIKKGLLIYEDGCLYPALPEPHIHALPEMLDFHTKWQELENLLSCARHAVIELSEKSQDSNHNTIDPDWFMRWRREASSVTNEDLRSMWGRILSEEIQSPGTISLRTLDKLKNITASEAKLFVELSIFILNDVLVCSETRLPTGYTYDDILELVDAGLLTSTETVRHRGVLDTSSGFRLFQGAGYWLYIHLTRKIEPVCGIPISKAGSELLKISDKRNARREEITKVCDIIRSSTPTGIEAMKAVLPGCSYNAFKEDVLYQYPYVSRRRRKF